MRVCIPALCHIRLTDSRSALTCEDMWIFSRLLIRRSARVLANICSGPRVQLAAVIDMNQTSRKTPTGRFFPLLLRILKACDTDDLDIVEEVVWVFANASHGADRHLGELVDAGESALANAHWAARNHERVSITVSDGESADLFRGGQGAWASHLTCNGCRRGQAAAGTGGPAKYACGCRGLEGQVDCTGAQEGPAGVGVQGGGGESRERSEGDPPVDQAATDSRGSDGLQTRHCHSCRTMHDSCTAPSMILFNSIVGMLRSKQRRGHSSMAPLEESTFTA